MASVHSDPVLLGTVVADAAGNVSFAFDVPGALLAGTWALLVAGGVLVLLARRARVRSAR